MSQVQKLHINVLSRLINSILKIAACIPFLHFQYVVPGYVTSLQVRPSTTIFGLIITWGPPSGSNYPTPVTYQLRYRESPYSGSPGGWSSTVQRTATQRQYTTPVLKPGTRYEVEVWAVSSVGNGLKSSTTSSTLQCMYFQVYTHYILIFTLFSFNKHLYSTRICYIPPSKAIH